MLNARERAELKSMNYCSKQHSGVEKAHFWQDKNIWNFLWKKKRAYWFGTAIFHLDSATTLHFNNTILFQFLSIRTLYVRTIPDNIFQCSPNNHIATFSIIIKHQWNRKRYCETFWQGLKGYSFSKNVLASLAVTGTAIEFCPLQREIHKLMVLKSMSLWADTLRGAKAQAVLGMQAEQAVLLKAGAPSLAGLCLHHQHSQHQIQVQPGLNHTVCICT